MKKIAIHDYAGHPFQVQLSRTLATRGYEIRHLYCGKLLTPRGSLLRRRDDAPSLQITAIEPVRPIRKDTLIVRRLQELSYGRRLLRYVHSYGPDVVLSGNAPLDVQRMLLRWCRSHGSRFVFWVQDLVGVATYKVLGRRFGLVGRMIGRHFEKLERSVLRRSDAIVIITEDFRPLLVGRGVESHKIHVIRNWAPIPEVPVRPKRNPWSVEHGLEAHRVVMYSGTLGMKHNPALLLHLARRVASRHDTRVVVVSEGPGADWLRASRSNVDKNLLLVGFQSFQNMPDVLATADVIVALLEPDAGIFSVPSKVLTALCARRPLVVAVPRDNLAARIVEGSGAGFAVEPSDADGFTHAVLGLLDDDNLRESLGAKARQYAERHFRIDEIADIFEPILFPSRPSASIVLEA